ncbi:MAG: DUF3500 domain-containing protein [Bacteroidia bacterium]|nr:DUF3500 domain-containing protein [Bacteroidia bacterium]
MKKLLLILFCASLFFSCKREGCTDPASLNYDAKAKVDDGSCEYGSLDCSTVSGLGTKSSLTTIANLATLATDFKNSLSSANLATMQYCLNDDELTLWAYLPENEVDREGLRIGEISAASLDLFESLLQGFLSNQGYSKVDWVINTLEPYISSQEGTTNYGSGYFTVTMFNDPATDGSWAIQLEGHHLAMVFVVNEDVVTFTPTFFGGRPRVYNGTNIYADEENLGLNFVNSLTTTQLAMARTDTAAPEATGYAAQKGANDDHFGTYGYDQGEKTQGIGYADLTSQQQTDLHDLIKYYVANYNANLTSSLLTDIANGLSQTRFVWKGSMDNSNVTNLNISASDRYYYRIYNPAILIEFDVTLYDAPEDTHHDHFVIRSPTGDFGPFASLIHEMNLEKHLKTSPHHAHERLMASHHHQDGTHHHHHLSQKEMAMQTTEKQFIGRLLEMMKERG